MKSERIHGILLVPQAISPEQGEQLRKSWREATGTSAIVLGGGIEFMPLQPRLTALAIAKTVCLVGLALLAVAASFYLFTH
jgi:uncharacterized membrane protein YczE